METLNIKVTGTEPLLMNNPQTVDPFNSYSREKKLITDKGKRKTEEDLMNLRTIEIESKLYMNDELGVYIPTSWIMAGLAANSFKKVKIAKKDVRSGVFMDSQKVKLNYEGIDKVNGKRDISGNEAFFETMLIKQGQVKLSKSTPKFHSWSFNVGMAFDPSVIDKTSLLVILEFCCNYGGFGDFRPTYGRATMEVLN